MISVITATLPERSALLAEAVASVTQQTLPPDEHLVGYDYRRRGGARAYNVLASAATSDWLAILPDDDVLYPSHIERLVAHRENADIVYSYCDVTGADPWTAYNQPFDAEALRRTSVVSHVALVRTQLVLDLDGWDDGPAYDYRFWLKALEHGARFVSVPERTWLYRLDAGWKHESRPWL